MKIKNLRQIVDCLDDDSEISIVMLWNEKEDQSVSTYDIGYEINDYGELVLQIALFDSDLTQNHGDVE